MVKICDVAKYFIKCANSGNEPLSHLKLQKLCYYAQAWHLAFFGESMFDDEFEAWVHGPVNYKLYLDYKKFGWSPIKENTEGFQDSIFDDNQLHVLKQVWKKYGRLDAKVLESLTHNEDPWKKARKDLDDNIYSNKVIDKNFMKSYYSSLLKNR
ncbi:type II toxin-antitoxin system antitoxin SocA domain-containing protein [Paenibacillus larvae]